MAAEVPIKTTAYSALVDHFSEFIEVAIHTILSVRELYPKDVFERRRYCELQVNWARHPGLQQYIHSLAFSLKPLILHGNVKKFAVIIHSKERKVMERFVFDSNIVESQVSKVEASELNYALRPFLIKLSLCSSSLKPLPADCTWELVAFSSVLPTATSENSLDWIPAEVGDIAGDPTIVPIKSLPRGPLKLQLYVESL